MVASDTWAFDTRAVHAGRVGAAPGAGRPEANSAPFVPVTPPIHPSVTYVYRSAAELDAVFGGEIPGYVYTRHGNPTLDAMERAVADLEGGEAAVSFASGMAALHAALLALDLEQGDRIVAGRDLYGATLTLLETVFRPAGIRVDYVDLTETAAARNALAMPTKAVLCETISNPLLRVMDVPMLAELARAAGAWLVVDSTFSTPYLIQPLALGAAVVVHSATKYLSGHGDVMGGVVAIGRGAGGLAEGLRERRRVLGSILGPHEAWLILRGMQTLGLRMQRHCANALQVAEWLRDRAEVDAVHYPGLRHHPQHAVAERLFGNRGHGGVVSFEVRDAGQPEVFRFMDALRLCLLGTTLGDVYSQLLYPARSSHRRQQPEARRAMGIGDGLVRLSVGIEAPNDIIADLERGFGAVRSSGP